MSHILNEETNSVSEESMPLVKTFQLPLLVGGGTRKGQQLQVIFIYRVQGQSRVHLKFHLKNIFFKKKGRTSRSCWKSTEEGIRGRGDRKGGRDLIGGVNKEVNTKGGGRRRAKNTRMFEKSIRNYTILYLPIVIHNANK